MLEGSKQEAEAWEIALDKELGDGNELGSGELSSPMASPSVLKKSPLKCNLLEHGPPSNRKHYFEVIDGQAKASVYDTIALRAAFLHACNSSVRPREMALSSLGPFLTAQQLLGLCQDVKLLKPEGPLSAMMVGVIYGTNKVDDEASGLTYSQFLDVLVELAFEVKRDIAGQLQEEFEKEEEGSPLFNGKAGDMGRMPERRVSLIDRRSPAAGFRSRMSSRDGSYGSDRGLATGTSSNGHGLIHGSGWQRQAMVQYLESEPQRQSDSSTYSKAPMRFSSSSSAILPDDPVTSPRLSTSTLHGGVLPVSAKQRRSMSGTRFEGRSAASFPGQQGYANLLKNRGMNSTVSPPSPSCVGTALSKHATNEERGRVSSIDTGNEERSSAPRFISQQSKRCQATAADANSDGESDDSWGPSGVEVTAADLAADEKYYGLGDDGAKLPRDSSPKGAQASRPVLSSGRTLSSGRSLPTEREPISSKAFWEAPSSSLKGATHNMSPRVARVSLSGTTSSSIVWNGAQGGAVGIRGAPSGVQGSCIAGSNLTSTGIQGNLSSEALNCSSQERKQMSPHPPSQPATSTLAKDPTSTLGAFSPAPRLRICFSGTHQTSGPSPSAIATVPKGQSSGLPPSGSATPPKRRSSGLASSAVLTDSTGEEPERKPLLGAYTPARRIM